MPSGTPSGPASRPPVSRLQWLLWIAPLVFLALFYFYPLGSILGLSFARQEGGWAAAFTRALSSANVWRVLGFTLGQALLSTFLTLLLGLPGAYLLARYQFRGKSLIQALTGLPFVMPTLVVAAAFNALLGPRGWVNAGLMSLFDLAQPPLQFTNTLTAILVAHVFYNTTIVLRMVGDFWSHLDPRLEQAAQTLGANRWQTLRHVTLPVLQPAVLAAALLVFIFDFTSFGVVLVLGGPRFATLEVEIYYQTVSLFNLPLAAVLSLIQLITTLGMTLLYSRLNARLARPLALKPRQITQHRLQGWRARLLAGAFLVFLLAFMTLPLLGLAGRSVYNLNPGRERTGEVAPGPTLAYYRALSESRRSALFYAPPATSIAISLGYAAATVVLAVGLGLPAALALTTRREGRVSRLLDPIFMLPLGTSAVTLGLGFIVALDQPPLDLRASPLLLPLAHTLVAFPFVVRSLAPSLASINPRLRQAAAVLGASPAQVLRKIDLPLVGRALLVAATFAFTISLGEFGATALVSRPEYPTIPAAIYRLISQPGALNYGQAMALSTILMVVSAAGMLFIERMRIADVGEF
ncbi:MAG TPA: iron ABC transporter permease [Anaerolineales bacterium]|nr:iron ABC transporter permease [Anaerolineales bacterium]